MQEMQELKGIIENGRINLLPAERVAENILAAGYCKGSKEEYSDYLMLKNNYENAKQEIEKLQTDCKRLYRNIGAFRDLIRKETAKEFAEKLKNRLSNCSGYYIPDCFESPTNEFAYNAREVEKIIDELLKEYEK